jgi:glucokinase-like ROK family protein
MNPQLSGSNINLVKAHNIQVILLSLLNTPCVSRVQLAKRSGLSNTTISNLVSELMEDGIIIEECEVGPPIKQTRVVGRPRTNIRLAPDARFVIGVHIGIGNIRVALTNLRDEIQIYRVLEFDVKKPVQIVLDELVECIERLITESGKSRKIILGVGVGASGLVDFQAGVNLLSTNLSWRNVPLRDILQEKLNLPVVVDNNVRTMAIAETYFGAGRNSSSLVFVYGRVGVGAGLTFKGEVYRGNAMGAGEIGHTIMRFPNGDLCHCGNHGCLETLVSESVIIQRANQIARENPDGILASLMKDKDTKPIELVFMASRQGDENVRQMLVEVGQNLGLALVNVVNLFNPELILLGGIFSQGQDFFLEPAIQTVRALSFGGMGDKVRIQPTSFGWKAGVLGAAALALINFFYHVESV